MNTLIIEKPAMANVVGSVMKPSRINYSIEQELVRQVPSRRLAVDMGNCSGDNLREPSLLFAFNADSAARRLGG
jgi:hypothetical protein